MRSNSPKPLHTHQVQVTLKCISDLALERDYYHSILSEDEKARAARFHFPKDQVSFTVTRGYLRNFLAKYLNIDPCLVSFTYNEFGKPSLCHQTHSQDVPIKFNLSHAGDYLAIAITQGIDVGIDIEKIDTTIAYKDIAQNFFSNAELNEINRQLPDQQIKHFFYCWTRKEAYIKGHGMGLSMPLKSFDVSTCNTQQPILLTTRHDTSSNEQWVIHHLNTPEPYVGAVSVNHQTAQLFFLNEAEFLHAL